MKKLVYIIVCLFLSVGCSTDKSRKEQVANTPQKELLKNEKIEPSHEDTIMAEIPSAEVVKPKQSVKKVSAINNKQINITYKGKDCNRIVKATDIFENIHYVPLETNDSSLLGNFPKNIINKNNYIYVYDTKISGQEIYLYNKDGGFLHHIGRKGQGPEEYLGGMHIAVSNQGVVSVLDRMNAAVINYTSENNFYSRIKLDSSSMYDGIFLTDSLLLVKNWYDSPGYKFHVVNVHSEKVVNAFYPIANRMFRIGFPEMMTKYDGKVLLSEFQSNEILELTKDSAKVRYIINVNDKMPPKGFWEQKVSSFSMIADEERRMGYIGHIPCFAENARSIFLGFWGSLDKDEVQGWAFIDKSTGKHQTFKRIMLADNVVIEPNFFYSQNDGRVVFAVSPETVLNSGNQAFINQFPGLKEDDNPILMFAEIK